MAEERGEEAVLSAGQVRKAARLSRLALSDAQVERHRRTLSSVLGYVARLRELDLEGVEPMSHPVEASARLEGDEPGETLPNSALMELAPETWPPFVKVPKVLGDGSGA